MAETSSVFAGLRPFEPDRFFLGSTRGSGLVRDVTGRLIDRCEISTRGWWDQQQGAMHFDETFVYEAGRTDILNWTFRPDPQGRMVATEPTTDGQIHGWTDGEDYRLRFRRRGEPPLASVYLTHDVRFSVMTPDAVLKVARVKLLGMTLGVMTAFHRRLDG
jgi:hypothetical protein